MLYQQEYGARNLWVMPYEMFLETVALDGQTVQRFEYLGPHETQQD